MLANRVGAAPPSPLFVKDKWDMLIDEDEEEDLRFEGPPVPRDMKYNMFNINRQRENFVSIKEVAGKDLTNDVYARDPETDTFWFVGKVARVSGEQSRHISSNIGMKRGLISLRALPLA